MEDLTKRLKDALDSVAIKEAEIKKTEDLIQATKAEMERIRRKIQELSVENTDNIQESED